MNPDFYLFSYSDVDDIGGVDFSGITTKDLQSLDDTLRELEDKSMDKGMWVEVMGIIRLRRSLWRNLND